MSGDLMGSSWLVESSNGLSSHPTSHCHSSEPLGLDCTRLEGIGDLQAWSAGW